MKKVLVLFAVVLIMSVTQLNAAPPGQVNDEVSANAMYVKYASVDWGEGLLLIGGDGFPLDAESLGIMLGDYPLEGIEYDEYGDIIALMPDDFMATDGFQGDVLLVIINTEKPVRTASFMFTIGAVGPQGDSGPMGPTGPQGLKGDTGAVGPKGLKGDDGDEGPVGPVGPAGSGEDESVYSATVSYFGEDGKEPEVNVILCNTDAKLVSHYSGSCSLSYLLLPSDPGGTISILGDSAAAFTCYNLLLPDVAPKGAWGICLNR